METNTDLDITKLTAPENWKENCTWFLDVDEDLRLAFAKKYCSKVYNCEGQACVIVSYPRPYIAGATPSVMVYDIDSGHIFLTNLVSIDESFLDVRTARAMFSKEPYRDSEMPDFEYAAVLNADTCDESMDISMLLFDHE